MTAKSEKTNVFLFVVALFLFALCSCSAGTQVLQTSDVITDDTAPITVYESETDAAEMKLKEIITFEQSKEITIRPSSWAPRVYSSGDGELIAGFETQNGIKTTKSKDGGKTWRGKADASFFPGLNCANVNFFSDGERLYLAYRAVGNTDKGLYTSLQVSVSDDNGKSWSYHSTVAEYTDSRGGCGVWEPYLGLLDGKLICMYANDHPSVTNYQNIEYRVWNGTEWTERTVISDGNAHRSRDGMPVWCESPDGGYLCIIESTAERGKGYPFVLKLFYSADGVNWSEPKTIYIPSARNSKAAAPGVAVLPDGRLAVSFQTDEDATVKGDTQSVMKIMFSDGTAVHELDKTHFFRARKHFRNARRRSVRMERYLLPRRCDLCGRGYEKRLVAQDRRDIRRAGLSLRDHLFYRMTEDGKILFVKMNKRGSERGTVMELSEESGKKDMEQKSDGAEEYIDDITYIRDMKHFRKDSWNQYDVVLAARGYGWEMMVDWADYIVSADLFNVSQVVSFSLAGRNIDCTKSFHEHNDKCSETPDLRTENGGLSVAGISRTLGAPMKIVWFNQTRILRFFTFVDDDLLITKYVETFIRRTFGQKDAMKLAKPIPEGN